ncbi:MAG: hypothetical protein LWX83_07145 [Anaerolineae bacterium]|nr:hypothetical protein [Anaerolineae bacterium]
MKPKSSEKLKSNKLTNANGFLFGGQPRVKLPWYEYAWMVVLYLLGGYLWGQFLNWGNIPFDFHDWAEINAPRLAFVRDAVLKWVLPLHMPDGSALRNLTDRFMALPDVFLSPQALLFHFLEVGPFILVNTLLLYTLSMWGLLWFRRRFSLSPLVFAFLFFLYNFNGHILAHMSIGHVTWGGYFLFPWYFALLFRLLDGDRRWRWSTEMGLLLFVIFLQGSFHQFVWGLMFLGLLAIVAWRNTWLPALKALILACMFSMVRFLPPTLLLGKFDTDFYGGYRWPQFLFEALVKQVTPATSLPFMNFSSNLGYWEFDLYVGWAGVIFLAVGLFLWLRSQVQLRRFSPFLLPMAIFLFLSFRDVYLPITYIPIPLLNGERVTSRLLIVPFTLSMFFAASSLQIWINQKRIPLAAKLAGMSLLGYLIFDLTRRVYQWQVTEAFKAFPNTPVNLAIKVVANHADPPYILMLSIGAGLSLISLIVAAIFVWRENR